jgi:hydrogenase maturation protease
VNREIAKKVADAVLYEGYMLYPYRPSAIKNRQRWTFGILYPPSYFEVRTGTERNRMHSEFLLENAGDATIQIQLRFLHLLCRQIEKSQSDNDRFEPVPSLLVGDNLLESWDEGTERSVEFEFTAAATSHSHSFNFPGSVETELLRDNSGNTVGRLSRTQQPLTGTISVSSEPIRACVFKISIDVQNDEVPTNGFLNDSDRNAALLRSLLSAHTILTATNGQFVSLLDPPLELQDAVRACNNIGNFPVLVGQQPERDMLLCSPIVLYDYPQIAPESASDFYDATEMDEMLTLRVMTLTDEEKGQMRLADDHVRNLLQRTEENARTQLSRTHGTIRSLRPVGEKP